MLKLSPRYTSKFVSCPSCSRVYVTLRILHDSKDLFDISCAQHNSTDKAISAVSVICYEFEMTGRHEFDWIAGNENFADVGTKLDSWLTNAHRLLLTSRLLLILHPSLPIHLADCAFR